MSRIKKLIKSFGYAFKGIYTVFRSEQNMQIHLMAVIVVVGAGLFFGITNVEWCLIILAIGLVMSAEAFNTAIESLTDLVHPERHPIAGKVKDAAAGGVLITAIAAAIIGILVFGKYILQLMNH